MLTCLTNGYLAVTATLLLFALAVIYSLQFLLGRWRAGLLCVRSLAWLRRALPSLVAFAAPLVALVPILLYASGNVPSWPISEFEVWSADPIDYVIPIAPCSLFQVLHYPECSIFSAVSRGTLLGQRITAYGNWVEHSLYVGIIPLLLAVYALIRNRDLLRVRYALVGLLFFVFSLGPVLHVAYHRTDIQLPYAFLVTLPLFSAARSVARFGIVPLVCVSLLSSMGLDDWLRRAARARMSVRRRQMLAFFLVGLTVLEFYPGTYPLTDPQQFSGSAYVWLSHQAGSYAILEYPVTHVDVLSGYHVLVSGKETVSGFVNIPSKALSDYLISVSFFQPDQTGAFSRPIDVPRLAELNIRFILFHKAAYAAAFGEQALVKALAVANMTEGLSYIGDFEGTALYQVMPTQSLGTHDASVDSNATLASLGTLFAKNAYPSSLMGNVNLSATSPIAERTVARLSLNPHTNNDANSEARLRIW